MHHINSFLTNTHSHPPTLALYLLFSPGRVSDPAPLTTWCGHSASLAESLESDSRVLCCRSWSWPDR
jgi:hypothetical protein